jgi:NitT/TauT family transport system substrate-binding protein
MNRSARKLKTRLTRRNVVQLTAFVPLSFAPLSGLSSAAFGQALTHIKLVGAAAVARPDQGFMFVGITTGFYKDLGIDGDFFTTAGSGSVIQLIATNQAQLGHCGMQELMGAKLKNPTLPVRAVFLQEVGAGYEIVVPRSGSIQSIAELKGKRIGVMSLASGAVPFVKSMLQSATVDPATVELLPVGTGAQALAALQSGRVDALSLFRGQHAALENLGIQLRYFTVPYPSSVMIANEIFLKNNRSALVHALQGLVLNQVFMRANPEAAVRSFWQINGRPKEDEAKALQDGVHLIERAAELWKKPDDNRKWGLMTDQDWTQLARFSAIDITPEQVSALYTDELIEEINKVDINVALNAAHRAQ